MLRIYQEHLSVKLDNSKGSVARDHLANERTYLAWLRTSLSVASAGVGVTQLLRLNTVDDKNRENERVGRLRRLGKPAGATLIGLALLVICFGHMRYFAAQAAMQQGKFPASRL
ncbi:Putative uncharacterized protein [Taphrina deformans PYCC 5710]|uniref:DUF202 domain-containing protein n=1 Tax=Taphrina deformans (strain PYCC 5710 / ATCC 11124 / CBS 356.35 / IMI 108563 / JCM 9778 / NBRC 8474) TaxID=1097556 RepID=R4XAZ3_TAPDE|nr:Putative uncharacterized protein [Taphrina deformans PYCC 5710]|eukprot:CCG82993.1 Putative uncharacterized protein [Taphrina deformans PYCC 5710]